MSNEIEIPPHNDDAEVCVLGAVMVDNRLWSIVEPLKRTSFYRPSHRLIFDAMAHLAQVGAPIDVITLADRLADQGQLESVGGAHALAVLSSSIPSVTSLPYYAHIVRDKASQRAYLQFAHGLAARIQGGELSADEIAREMAGQVKQDLAAGHSRNTQSGAELASGLKEWIKQAISGANAGGTSTGIPMLDDLLGGGVQGGRLYLIGGLTKMGKTTLAIGVAAHLLFKEGWVVDFVSSEMSHVEISSKFSGWLANVEMERFVEMQRQAVRGADVSPADMAALMHMADAIEALRLAPLHIRVEGRPLARDIALMARARQMEIAAAGRDPSKYLLIVDYLQICQTGNERQNDSDRISECSQTLNAISKDLGIPVFVIFQFDKKADDAFDQYGVSPSYARLKGSSQPAQDANHFLVATRIARRSENLRDQSYFEIVQELSRHGKGGEKIGLYAHLGLCKFSEWRGEPPRSHVNPAQQQQQGGRR